MPRGKSIDEVLTESEQIIRVWEANPAFSLGEVTRAAMQTKVDELRTARTQTENLRTQLTQAVNDANGKADDLNAIVTRARSGFRAMYGPDSSQYEQAGGTRASERKPRKASKSKTS
ncbi:MAG: hypothetical protein QOJ02_1918 [Acidobacteriota bacterium]|nr:hypothetical protein [Acidobacteriota bacterium]